MSEIDYEKLADAIATKLAAKVPADKVLWDGKQCAQYLVISEKHFVDKVSKSYNFPAPVRLPSETGRRAHARWYAAEIMNWINNFKQAS